MAVIHGRNLKITDDNSNAIIAGAKSCSINKQVDVIETASSSSGTAKTYIAGRTEWSINVSHLVMAEKGGIPMVGQTYSLKVVAGNAGVLSGTAICTAATIDAIVGNLAQGSIKFKGTGALTES